MGKTDIMQLRAQVATLTLELAETTRRLDHSETRAASATERAEKAERERRATQERHSATIDELRDRAEELGSCADEIGRLGSQVKALRKALHQRDPKVNGSDCNDRKCRACSVCVARAALASVVNDRVVVEEIEDKIIAEEKAKDFGGPAEAKGAKT